jgi:hypothetical protein
VRYLGGRERSFCASRRLDGENRGAFKKRCRCGQPAARLRSLSRALELSGNLVVGAGCRTGEMPRPSVWVRGGVGCGGERAVHSAAITSGRLAVRGGTCEGMWKFDPSADRQHLGVDRGVDCREIEPQYSDGAAEQLRTADRLRCSDKDTELRVSRKLPKSVEVAAFDLSGDRKVLGQSEAAGEGRSVPGTREFEQRERVAATFGDDLVAYVWVERTLNRAAQERARVEIGEPLNGK